MRNSLIRIFAIGLATASYCFGSSLAISQAHLTLDREWSKVGTWKIYANYASSSCFVFTIYEDGTVFWFGLSGDEKTGLMAIANKAKPDGSETA